MTKRQWIQNYGIRVRDPFNSGVLQLEIIGFLACCIVLVALHTLNWDSLSRIRLVLKSIILPSKLLYDGVSAHKVGVYRLYPLVLMLYVLPPLYHRLSCAILLF